jgi:hypothetical protein
MVKTQEKHCLRGLLKARQPYPCLQKKKKQEMSENKCKLEFLLCHNEGKKVATI